MQIDYVAPQFTLAGEVDRVVLGGAFGGGDFHNEAILPGGGLLLDDDAEDIAG